jgi:hypothetical protein
MLLCHFEERQQKKTYRRMMDVDGPAFEMWYVDMLVQMSRCGHEYMHESAAVESPEAGLGRTTETPAGDSFINLFIRTSVRGRRFSRGEGYVAMQYLPSCWCYFYHNYWLSSIILVWMFKMGFQKTWALFVPYWVFSPSRSLFCKP